MDDIVVGDYVVFRGYPIDPSESLIDVELVEKVVGGCVITDLGSCYAIKYVIKIPSHYRDYIKVIPRYYIPATTMKEILGDK